MRTLMVTAPATTCALVTISPSAVMMTPLPVDCPSTSLRSLKVEILTTAGPTALAAAYTSSVGNGSARGGTVTRPSVLACRAGARSSSAQRTPIQAPSKPAPQATSTTTSASM
jgi:hypothetical protein